MYCFVLQKNNNNAKMNTTVVTITKQSCHESSLDNKAKVVVAVQGKSGRRMFLFSLYSKQVRDGIYNFSVHGLQRVKTDL